MWVHLEEPWHLHLAIFPRAERLFLYRVVLGKSETCLQGLWAPPIEHVAILFLPILYVYLDNCWRDNKYRFVRAFWSILTAKRIFIELHVFIFWLVIHVTTLTHHLEDGMTLCEYDYLIILPLFFIKSYMGVKKVSIIPQMLEEISD